jgi:hypothetical protein
MKTKPELSSAALSKLEQLLASHPDAKVSGVLIRTGPHVVTITTEGRIQWHKQDTLGGIHKTPEPSPPRSLDRMKNARRT